MCTAHANTAQAAADKFGVTPRVRQLTKRWTPMRRSKLGRRGARAGALWLTENAIEAGKDVFCEWPLGANTKEAEDLVARARKKNVRTMVGLQRRASPLICTCAS